MKETKTKNYPYEVKRRIVLSAFDLILYNHKLRT